MTKEVNWQDEFYRVEAERKATRERLYESEQEQIRQSAEIERLQTQIDKFYAACCYLDRALPIRFVPHVESGVRSDVDNPTRIRQATDEILRLRSLPLEPGQKP